VGLSSRFGPGGEFRVSGLGVRVWDSLLGLVLVESSGFRVWELGCGVYGNTRRNASSSFAERIWHI